MTTGSSRRSTPPSGPARGSSSCRHVLWTTGARLPIEAIAELAHDRGAIVAVDGAQAAGAIPVNVAELGVDFYAIPARNGCSGRRGPGALWASPGVDRRARASRRQLVHLRADRRRPGRALAGRAAVRGQRPLPAVRSPVSPGAAAGCRCTSGCRGSTSAARRMARPAADRLAAIDGVEVLTPRDRMATLVTFRIARLGRRDRRSTELAGADVRDRPDDPAARRAPDQRRLLHDRGRDRAGRGGGRAARGPHAGDAAAAAAR